MGRLQSPCLFCCLRPLAAYIKARSKPYSSCPNKTCGINTICHRVPSPLSLGCPFLSVVAQTPRTLQLLSVSAPWLLCAGCGLRLSDYVFSSHPPCSSGRVIPSPNLQMGSSTLWVTQYGPPFLKGPIAWGGPFQLREQQGRKL